MISWLKLIRSKNILRWLLNYSVCYDSAISQVLLYVYGLVFKQYRDFRVVPFQWMDQSVNYQKWLLRIGSNAMAYGPHYFNDIQTFKAVRLPDVNCRSFTNARISTTSSSVVLNDKEALIERAEISNQDKFVYSAGHIVMHRVKTAIVRLGDAVAIEKGIFLGVWLF